MSNEDLFQMLADKDEEIERLKEQLNDEIDDELKQSEIMVKQQNEIERLNKESEQLRTALNSKESIIKEAIEYIKNNYPVCAGADLLKILSGEDNENIRL